MLRTSRLALALLAFVAMAAFGCGEEDATDESFVRDLCGATTQLQSGLATALADSRTQTDPAKAVEVLVPPLDAFVKAFEDIRPPKDLDEWHESSTTQLRASVDKFETEKTLSSLEGFGDSPVPDLPAAAKLRLRETGDRIEECNGVAFLRP